MPLTSPRGLEMLEYLPRYYDESFVMREILQVLGAEFDSLRAAIDQALEEFFIDTATDRGLDRFESEYALPPGDGMTITDRRDRLRAKIRGYGTANIAKVEEVADAFVFGEAEVDDQSTDPSLPNYTIRVRFVDEIGIPNNMVDVENAIRAVVPAHLAIEYVFRFSIWNDIDTADAGGPHTWDEWDVANGGVPFTWAEIEIEYA